jgi:coenzyme F420-reducing hydrogenase delta subunit
LEANKELVQGLEIQSSRIQMLEAKASEVDELRTELQTIKEHIGLETKAQH